MKRNRYPQWDDEILELYSLGFSIREIANIIHWSFNFVRNRLLHHGVELRGRGGNRKYTPRAVLAETEVRYKACGSMQQVAEEMGCSRTTVNRRLRKTKTKINSQGGWWQSERGRAGHKAGDISRLRHGKE